MMLLARIELDHSSPTGWRPTTLELCWGGETQPDLEIERTNVQANTICADECCTDGGRSLSGP
eukprot:9300059-Pyramimonas_sp.AAC.1